MDGEMRGTQQVTILFSLVDPTTLCQSACFGIDSFQIKVQRILIQHRFSTYRHVGLEFSSQDNYFVQLTTNACLRQMGLEDLHGGSSHGLLVRSFGIQCHLLLLIVIVYGLIRVSSTPQHPSKPQLTESPPLVWCINTCASSMLNELVIYYHFALNIQHGIRAFLYRIVSLSQ